MNLQHERMLSVCESLNLPFVAHPLCQASCRLENLIFRF